MALDLSQRRSAVEKESSGMFDLNAQEIKHLYKKYLNPVSTSIISFIGSDRKFVKAEGIDLTDEEGNTYMDFYCAFGAVNLGHEPDEILAALKDVEGRPNILQSILNPYAAKCGESLAHCTPGNLSRTFFCNSGTEAVEAALKLSRCVSGKEILLSTENAFHGKTFGALSVSGKEKYKKMFMPLVPGTRTILYDDLPALEEELKKGDIAGFIVEPVQGEAGIIVPSDGYLKGAEVLCRKYRALFIIDEVQTGMGRTGKLFCCEYENVEPDIFCLSKSLGGGVMPVGAMVTTDKIWKKAYGSPETAFLHTTTFGGNGRACACAAVALKMINDPDLLHNVREQGDYLLLRLEEMQKRFSFIKAVRGKGLMIGIHFASLKGNLPLLEGALALWAVRDLFKRHKILTAFTFNNYDVLRIMPPLTVNRAQVELFLDALEGTLKGCEKFSKWKLVKKD